MAIRYEAFTWSGRKVSGVLETDSEDDAYDLLEKEELVPYRLWRVRRRPSLVELAPFLFKPKTQVLIDFSNQMASLLGSGVPLRQSLIIQRDQAGNPGLKHALRKIVEGVEAGDRFSDAVSRHPTVFSDLYVRLLKVGEATGGIAFTLEQIAENLQRRKTVTDKVKGALTYPLTTVVLASLALLVLVKFSIPPLVGLLDEFGGELPWATNLVLTSSEFLQAYVNPILIGIALAATLAFVYMRTADGLRRRDAVLLRMPLASKILMTSNMFILTSTFVMLVREAGTPTIESLRLTEEALVNVILRERLHAATDEAEQGTRLGEAFSRQTIFPAVLTQAINIGDVRGTQADTLGGLASYYEMETERAIGIAVELVQPTVIMAVAGLVGFVAIAVVSGVYSTLQNIE